MICKQHHFYLSTAHCLRGFGEQWTLTLHYDLVKSLFAIRPAIINGYVRYGGIFIGVMISHGV